MSPKEELYHRMRAGWPLKNSMIKLTPELREKVYRSKDILAELEAKASQPEEPKPKRSKAPF